MDTKLLKALQILAGRDTDYARELNGIGFNGSDSGYGHWLVENPTALDKPKYAASAYKMIQKYCKQLASCGLDISEIPAPAAPPPDRRIEVKDGVYKFFAPYNDRLVELWRCYKVSHGASWNSTEKCWEVSTELGTDVATRMNEEFNFVFTPDAVEEWASGALSTEEVA